MAEIRISSDLPAYVAVPEGEGPWPAVVIVFESFGDNADMRAQADRFAARGYLAVLPDLYAGRNWVRCVRKAFRDLLARRGPTFARIEAARRWAAGRDDCTGRVGVVGFCMGGGFALVAAAKLDFQAASVNYGIVPRHAERVLDGACPIVATYGGEDRSLPGAAAKLERALTLLDVTHDVKEYAGAGHSFLTESDLLVPRPLTAVGRVALGLGKGKERAPEAWERILGFLDGQLENGSAT